METASRVLRVPRVLGYLLWGVVSVLAALALSVVALSTIPPTKAPTSAPPIARQLTPARRLMVVVSAKFSTIESRANRARRPGR